MEMDSKKSKINELVQGQTRTEINESPIEDERQEVPSQVVGWPPKIQHTNTAQLDKAEQIEINIWQNIGSQNFEVKFNNGKYGIRGWNEFDIATNIVKTDEDLNFYNSVSSLYGLNENEVTFLDERNFDKHTGTIQKTRVKNVLVLKNKDGLITILGNCGNYFQGKLKTPVNCRAKNLVQTATLIKQND